MNRVLLTQMFRDIVRKLPRDDIQNLCTIDRYFGNLCKVERDFIRREIRNRTFYVRVETDMDGTNTDPDGQDITHTVTITKTPPNEMFGDFFSTHPLELIDYDHDQLYVLFYFVDTGVVLLEVYTDKRVAIRAFNEVIGNTEESDNVDPMYVIDDAGTLDFTLYDDDIIHRWRLVRIPLK